MDCCLIPDPDAPRWDVGTERVVRARKPHVCCECREPIVPGQRYELVKGCWEGDWSSHKTCLPCVAIRDQYCCDGYVYGGLWWALIKAMDEEWSWRDSAKPGDNHRRSDADADDSTGDDTWLPIAFRSR